MKRKTGTLEWASSNVNFLKGCKNNCGGDTKHYCYAKQMAMRFGRIQKWSDWKDMEINWEAVNKGYAKRKGKIMFPSSHGLFPEHLDDCIIPMLTKMLKAGNEVVIVTKPDIDVITNLMRPLKPYREQLLFRFTITSSNNELLQRYEPGAPTYEHRLHCLQLARECGYETSVSVEPFLDTNPIELMEALLPYITETIWLGKMNHGPPTELQGRYGIERLRDLWRAISTLQKIDPSWGKVRYKDSMQRAVGIDQFGVKTK